MCFGRHLIEHLLAPAASTLFATKRVIGIWRLNRVTETAKRHQFRATALRLCPARCVREEADIENRVIKQVHMYALEMILQSQCMSVSVEYR